jgi:hypothetical protein
VVVEAQRRNAATRKAIGKMAKGAMRARVLVSDRRTKNGDAVARRRRFVRVKPAEGRVRAITDV